PSDFTPDCFVPVQVNAGGDLSNVVSIAVAASGQDACSDPQADPAILSKLDAGGDIILAAFGLVKVNSTSAGGTTLLGNAAGAVLQYTATAWMLSQLGPKFDYCRLYDRTFPLNTADPGAPTRTLDAGARLPLSGPNLPAGAALGTTDSPTGPVYI